MHLKSTAPKTVSWNSILLGDMEKELGRTPLQQNDRKKACIPSLQIKFNDFILAPLYTLLIELLPPAQVVVDQLEENRLIWESISIKHNLEENHNCVKWVICPSIIPNPLPPHPLLSESYRSHNTISCYEYQGTYRLPIITHLNPQVWQLYVL